jgi:hypothetical protein
MGDRAGGDYGMRPDQNLDDFERKIIDNVRDHGCQVNFVFDPDKEVPDFSYSIGFPETVKQPEVIVFGLRQDVMHFMVNEVLVRCRSGLKLADLTEIYGLLEGCRCIIRRVHPSTPLGQFFGWAMWFHRFSVDTELTDVVQIVWPGKLDGLFPWEEGCNELVIERQLPLYLPRGSM